MVRVMYRQIAEDLRRRIVSGEMAEGALLPTEAALCELWGTSRGPVRNALAQLRREGLIDTGQGRQGSVISRQARQPIDVYLPFTRWAEVHGRQPGAHTVSLSLRRAGEDCAAQLDVPPEAMVVELVRLRLLDGEPTMLERTRFREDVGRLLFDADLEAGSITAYLATRGLNFDQVEVEIDAIGADPLDADLLGIDEASPVLRLRRRSSDADGRAFEYSDDRYRSDTVRFTVNAAGGSNGERGIRPTAGASHQER
ncbi:GntR family transcriptional regulator [Kocuria coralli]|nr:GntR family transcriptional regulator [Kocuria coralli]